MAAGLVTMSDVYRHLNLQEGDTSYQPELQGFIDAATPIVNYLCGPVLPTSFTENYDTTNTDSVCLTQCPVLSIQSITEYVGSTANVLTNQPRGSTADNYGYSLDQPQSGRIARRGSTGERMNFIGSEIVVAYTAGRASVPANIRLAVLDVIRATWQQTQQVGRPSFSTQATMDDSWVIGRRPSEFMFPRLRALLEGAERLPGIA